MASQGPNSPGTATNDTSIGTKAFSDVNNAFASDNAYATASAGLGIRDTSVKLVKGGTIVGDNKFNNTLISGTDTYRSNGGSSDLWGTTLTPTEVNGSDFGVAYSYTGDGGVTNYLLVTGFNFNIPTDATIDGVVTESETSASGSILRVDHIRITVYYTPAPEPVTVWNLTPTPSSASRWDVML